MSPANRVPDPGRYIPAEDRERLISFGRLKALSGASDRALKHWIDARAIYPTSLDVHTGVGHVHPGKGRHRVFDPGEVVVAALLVPLANAGIPISNLVLFADIIRRAWYSRQAGAPTAGHDPGIRELGLVLVRAVRGVGANGVALAIVPVGNVYFAPLSDQEGQSFLFDISRFVRADDGKVKAAAIVLDLADWLTGLLDTPL